MAEEAAVYDQLTFALVIQRNWPKAFRADPDAVVVHTVAPVLLAVGQLTGGPHG